MKEKFFALPKQKQNAIINAGYRVFSQNSYKKSPIFHVKKRTLLAIAGCVWFLAGFNVARLGVITYTGMNTISWYHPVLSVVVFALFGLMFFKMSFKHTNRIHGYSEPTRPFWHFFDLKAYCIMAVMMGGGIWLRYSGLVPKCSLPYFTQGSVVHLRLQALYSGLCFSVIRQW